MDRHASAPAPLRPSGRRWSWLQLLLALGVVLSLSGVAHAAEELVESAVHVAETGHGAHCAEHPEGTASNAEHFCFGSVHNCGCCPSAVDAPRSSVRLPPQGLCQATLELPRPDAVRDGVRDRVDRPPRG